MGGAPLQPGSDAAACLALSVPVKVHPKPSQLQTLDTSPRSTTSFPPTPPTLHPVPRYLALYMGTDTSSVAFTSDSYAVFWGQYQVKRFLS